MVSRSGQYGSYLGSLVKYCIKNQEEMGEEEYKRIFLDNLEKFDPENPVEELEEIEEIDIEHPSHLSKLVKEGMNLMYQRKTSERTKKKLKEVLEE